MNPAAEVWNKVKALMGAEMTATTLNTWFDDAQAVALQEDRFILYTPTKLKRDIIASRYVLPIQNALHELFSANFQVTVLTEGELDGFQKETRQSSFLPGTEEYTFEHFVVGSSNKLAHAAARKVADNPGENYNPLFIFGNSGLGKTHLLYAIAHAVHASYPGYKIIYVKGDAFTNELIAAIREGKNQEFRDKYRQADVFLMDDVQFIAGKDSSEEELFHTFNTLYEQKKQIVFTSDRPPHEMLRLEQRLKTRFEQGLPADIQPPDYETRVALLKNKAVERGISLPDPVLSYVAENITSNVRQIEGVVNKIMAFQELMGAQVDVETTVRAVRDILRAKENFLPSADTIIQEVARFYELDAASITGQSQNKEISTARNVAMYIIREMTQLSLAEIGQQFGGRHHSTVLNSINRVEKMMKAQPELSEIIRDITNAVNSAY